MNSAPFSKAFMFAGIKEWYRLSNTFSKALDREAIWTSLVFSVKAPMATMLASFAFPVSSAMSLNGIGRRVTS